MAMEISPRVGYIGTGWTERVQIPAFALGGLAAQAIASGQVANAERVAVRYGIPEVYGDWRELVQSRAVDVVSICAPPHLHKEMAIAALEAGKHVICEKPMALDTAEAEAMFAAAQAHPEQIAIIDHELRFHPARLQLRHLIREGAIGHLLRKTFLQNQPPFPLSSEKSQGEVQLPLSPLKRAGMRCSCLSPSPLERAGMRCSCLSPSPLERVGVRCSCLGPLQRGPG